MRQLARAARGRGRALRMHNAAAGRHPVYVPGPDFLHGAQAVAVFQLARKEIGYRRQGDMRVRPHVDPGSRFEDRRSQVIEKYERSHHLASREGQHPAHHEAAQVALP